MQIYEALIKDHEEVKELLNRLLSLGDSSEQERHELVDQIRDALIPHSRAEEAVFYNSLRESGSDYGIAAHGYREHMEAEALLRTLQMKDSTHMDWRVTANKLKDALEHHITEEEGEMFDAAHEVFTDEEAEMMAGAFQKMKPEIKEEGFMGTTLDMIANLMPPRFTNSFRHQDILLPKK